MEGPKMAVSIPTTQSIADAMIARLEAIINQAVPSNNKSFARTWAQLTATNHTALYLYGADAVLQNYAQTANLDGLRKIGNEIGTIYKGAVSTVLSITLPATLGGGATIGVDNSFVGDANGVKYNVDAEVSESNGVINISVTSETPGALGNLSAGVDTLTITKPVSGANRLATVSSVTTTGADDEDTEVYRARVLFELRTAGGGGNAADNKRWAEEVEGVRTAYPYSGNPSGPSTSLPGERTVYVEAQTAIDADGIPTTALLTQVRTSLNTDPDNGESRQPLGLTDSMLFVEPISRTAFGVQIINLTVSAENKAAAKSDLDTDMDTYFRSIEPYVDGVDVQADRRDTITQVSVAEAVNGILRKYGATAGTITVTKSAVPFTEYQLGQGEKAKLDGSVTYA
jgi:uncharacterized phage protein gp47/JayE